MKGAAGRTSRALRRPIDRPLTRPPPATPPAGLAPVGPWRRFSTQMSSAYLNSPLEEHLHREPRPLKWDAVAAADPARARRAPAVSMMPKIEPPPQPPRPPRTFYRRPFPSALVSFSSRTGRARFQEALADGTLEPFWALAENAQMQVRPRFPRGRAGPSPPRPHRAVRRRPPLLLSTPRARARTRESRNRRAARAMCGVCARAWHSRRAERGVEWGIRLARAPPLLWSYNDSRTNSRTDDAMP